MSRKTQLLYGQYVELLPRWKSDYIFTHTNNCWETVSGWREESRSVPPLLSAELRWLLGKCEGRRVDGGAQAADWLGNWQVCSVLISKPLFALRSPRSSQSLWSKCSGPWHPGGCAECLVTQTGCGCRIFCVCEDSLSLQPEVLLCKPFFDLLHW